MVENIAYNQGKLVYHYTRSETFLKIIEGMQDGKIFLRASSMHGLNDTSEFVYGVKQLRRILPAIEHTIQKEGCKIDDNQLISKAIVEDERRHSGNWCESFADYMLKGYWTPYVISTSSKRDYIPMWSMYGDAGKGIAIGIDVANCVKKEGEILTPNEGPQAFKVVQTLSLNHPASLICKKDYRDYLTKVRNVSNQYEVMRMMVLTFGQMTLYTAPLLKHPAYTYENEWRLIAFKQQTDNLKFSINNKSNMTSYIEVAIPIEQLRKIVIGPCCSNAYQIYLIKKMLYDKGIKDCKITKSKVPLRM